MKIITPMVFLVMAGLFLGLEAQTPDGEWIVQKMDENFGSDNKIYVGTMIVHGRRGSRTIKSKSWLQGVDQSFTEFLSPPREAGTKMLKLEDEPGLGKLSAFRAAEEAGMRKVTIFTGNNGQHRRIMLVGNESADQVGLVQCVELIFYIINTMGNNTVHTGCTVFPAHKKSISP